MIKENLDYAKRYIDTAITKLETVPDKDTITDLLIALEGIEDLYQQFCVDMDEENGDEPGTAYEHGTDSDFYIEGEWWHDVSVALRKLKEPKDEKPN